jgi:PKHD-type hydroxylase
VLLRVPGLLGADQLARVRASLEKAEWVDGRATAGRQSAEVKRNMQVREGTPEAQAAGAEIVAALERSALFVSAALPLRIFPPLFNRYETGDGFGNHVDNAIRRIPETPYQVRTDLSATLFLSAPEDYDGGELVVEDVFGVHDVKLPAGDLILYPASSLHHVRPLTRGSRVASFFWVQSMIRDDGARSILFDLDLAIQNLERTLSAGATVPLTNVYHNLLRRWADV